MSEPVVNRVLENLRIVSATLRNKAAEDSLTEEVRLLVGDVEPFATAAFVELYEARYPCDAG